MRIVQWCMLVMSLWVCGVYAQPPAYEWQNITVGAGGFAPGIVYSESEPDLAYLRTDMGGLYRWDSQQKRWRPLMDEFIESSYFGIESVALDPNDSDKVYVAAGMYKGRPATILRSSDRGEHWQSASLPLSMGGNEDGRGLGERLAVNPNNPQHLLFGSRHDGLWQSLDGAATWQQLATFPYAGQGVPEQRRKTNGGVSFVVFLPHPQPAILVGVADQGHQAVYLSTDQGKQWKKVTNTVRPDLLPVKAAYNDHSAFVTFTNGLGPNGITDGALLSLNLSTLVWKDISPEMPKTSKGGYMGISVSRQHPDTLVVSSVNRWQPYDTVWYSKDAGHTWHDLYHISKRDVSNNPFLYWGNPEPDFGWWIAGLAINPFDDNQVVYTTGATLYRTDNVERGAQDKQVDWYPWTKGIEQTAIITLTSLPEGPKLLSGFGDISGFVHRDFSRSPTTQYTNPVFANTNNIEFALHQPNLVVRSGTPAHRAHGHSPTFAISQDFGLSWKPLPLAEMTLQWPDKQGHYQAKTKRPDGTGDHYIHINSDGTALAIATPQALFSRDNGKQWAPSASLPLGLHPIFDRQDPNLVYALDFAKRQIWVSRDKGVTFNVNSATGLPEDIIQAMPTWREKQWPLMPDAEQSGKLWLFAPQGLFVSTDNGQHFAQVNKQLSFSALAQGKAKDNHHPLTLFAIARENDKQFIWRSLDGGVHWQVVNDNRHQYGQRFRCLSADWREFGQVYVGTDGRGIVMGTVKE